MINNQEIALLPCKGLTVQKIIEVTGAKYSGPRNLLENEITGVNSDSRKIVKGNLFAAIKGARVDGHQFTRQTIQAGAIACICESEVEDDIPSLLVEDTQIALKQIATYYRQTLKIPIVAIIGSVGKTSTKEAIANVLGIKFRVLKNEGNLNNELGLPLTIMRIKPCHEVAVVEMGINHFGEMTRLAQIARPDILVFTNVGNCHLEFLGDRPGVFRAKSEAFDHLHNKDSVVIINGDDDILRNVDNVGGNPVITFGLDDSNNIHITNIRQSGLEGTDATLHIKNLESSIHIPLPGLHSVYNTMAAACVASTLNMSLEEITKGISNINALPGHGKITKTNKYTILDEAYNANPESMKASIDLLESANTTKVAILGDMAELGTNEAMLHKEIGHYLANKNIDSIILIGNLSHNTLEGILEINSSANCKYYKNVESFITDINSLIRDGDSVLVKASNSMNFSQIINLLKSK